MGESGHNPKRMSHLWGVYNKSGIYLIFIGMLLNWHDIDRDATDRQHPWEADRSNFELLIYKRDYGSSPLKYQLNE